jgi:hypothetical protein
MEIDGAGSSPVYETSYEPTPEPSSEPPAEPAYTPPSDGVDYSAQGTSSADSSAAAWAEGTIAAAEAYSAQNGHDYGFGDKTAEERAQDEFWKNDPNRPPDEPPPAPPPEVKADKEDDDIDPKNPINKPPEDAQPTDDGPVEPLPGGTPGTLPPDLTPTPPPPTPPWLGPPPPPPPPTAPTKLGDLIDAIKDFPLRPTHSTTHAGTDLFGVSSNPPPKPPEPLDPTTKSHVPSEP